MDIEAVKAAIPTSPAFLLDYDAIRETLTKLVWLKRQSACEVLYSIKSLPLSCLMEWVKPDIDGFSVSSLFEARMADEILAGAGCLHITTPGLRLDEISEINARCRYISFNSISQYQRLVHRLDDTSSLGLRINPQLSFCDDIRYDPCRRHSKLGVSAKELCSVPLPEKIQGLHFHNVFSYRNFEPLIKTLDYLQSTLNEQFAHLRWLNMGGGYLFDMMNNFTDFIVLVNKLKQQQTIDVFIEPGNAVVGNAGYLMTTIIDRFESDGKVVAVLDTSVNHQPEVFEYQIKPPLLEEHEAGEYRAILAGSTCLAGDLFGEYCFNKPLQVGDRVVFTNVGAYSLIKANRFNGYNLPDIYRVADGRCTLLKRFTYQDFRSQWVVS